MTEFVLILSCWSFTLVMAMLAGIAYQEHMSRKQAKAKSKVVTPLSMVRR